MITEVTAILISSGIGFISGAMCMKVYLSHKPWELVPLEEELTIHERETLPETPPTLRTGTNIDEPLKQRLSIEVEWCAPVDVVRVDWPINEGDNRVLITYRPHENAALTAEDMVAMIMAAKRLLPSKWTAELVAGKSHFVADPNGLCSL